MSSSCLASVHRCTLMALHGSSRNVLQLLKTSDSNPRMMHAIALPFNIFNQKTETASSKVCVKQTHTSSRLQAGHSKWQNIKHIKAAFDREKGQKSNILAHKIQLVLERNPDTDPKQNTELANLVKWARANNLSNDVINNSIERQHCCGIWTFRPNTDFSMTFFEGRVAFPLNPYLFSQTYVHVHGGYVEAQVKRRDPSNISFFAGRGPSNTGIVIECFSPKPRHTKDILQGYVKKYGFNLNVPADDLFTHKGVVEVNLSEEEVVAASADPEHFPLDKYVEVAIVVGAEDVKLEYDGDKPCVQFLCGPSEVSKVSRNLNDAGFNIIRSERTYLPTVTVTVTQEFLESLTKLSEKLDLNADVIKYYFNVVPES